jgi:hypothetical protein
MKELVRFVKSHPGTSLMGAVAAGYVLRHFHTQFMTAEQRATGCLFPSKNVTHVSQ